MILLLVDWTKVLKRKQKWYNKNDSFRIYVGDDNCDKVNCSFTFKRIESSNDELQACCQKLVIVFLIISR